MDPCVPEAALVNTAYAPPGVAVHGCRPGGNNLTLRVAVMDILLLIAVYCLGVPAGLADLPGWVPTSRWGGLHTGVGMFSPTLSSLLHRVPVTPNHLGSDILHSC